MSWHKDDWLKFGGLLGLGASGLGLAGIGPLAGLLGASSSAAAALGPGAAAEVGSAAAGAPGFAPLSGLLGGLDKGGKGLQALMKAQQLMAMAQAPQAQVGSAQRPSHQQQVSGDGMDYIRRIYGGLA